MASFQAKIGWKWPRKRQKYKLLFRFVRTHCVIENSKQITKKIQKIIKYYYGFISRKNKGGNADKWRK